MFCVGPCSGVSLSEPHTSKLSSKSVTVVAFTNKYIHKPDNSQMLLYKCNCHALYKAGTCVTVIHHQSSLLMLHKRLVQSFITRRITRVVLLILDAD